MQPPAATGPELNISQLKDGGAVWQAAGTGAGAAADDVAMGGAAEEHNVCEGCDEQRMPWEMAPPDSAKGSSPAPQRFSASLLSLVLTLR